MTRSRAVRLLFTLLLTFALGLSSGLAANGTSHVGHMWPVGLATGALVVSGRQLKPYVVIAVGAIALVTFLLSGHPGDVSLGYALGISTEAFVAAYVLTADGTRRPTMVTNADLGRFALACTLGAWTGAGVFTGVSAITGFGTPWQVGVATLVTHLAAEAVVLGIFLQPTPGPGYGGTERTIAWVVTIAVTIIAFVPAEVPSLAVLVVPAIGWMAFRAPMREAMVQLLVVSIVSSALTNWGFGAFDHEHLASLLPREFELLPLNAFLLACAMVSYPFSMAVEMQRRSAGQALMERERSEQLIQSAVGIAIIGTDENGRINLFSPGAQRLLGYRPYEIYGRSTRMFHTDAEIARQAAELGTAPTFSDVIAATRALPPGTPREWRYVRRDGVERTLSTILSPITDAHGRIVGYVATADDVTDRLDTQAALEKALQTERTAVRRLTEVDRVKDTFVSSVSHELRTPITNIVGYLELLLDGAYGELGDQQANALRRIEINSRRLLSLIDDLLTLSSLENIDQLRHPEPVDLTVVVRRAEEIVRPTLMRRDLTLTVELPDSPVFVSGDPGQLERLVINLATNAVKFTPDGGTVRITVAEESDGPVLEVCDTGIGIREADLPMLFSRFYRAAHAREHAVPGSGLGLSIAKAITEAHGGRISARSSYGKGSTFRVEFPLLAQVPS